MSYRVRVGETVQGSNWRLVQLEPRRAVIEGPSGQRVLDLRVFDGKGGEAPTQIAAANATRTTPEPSARTEQRRNGGQGAPSPSSVPPSPPQATPEASAQSAPQVVQDEQVEAIRRRIEARRAQMRAEAAASSATEKQ